MTPLTTLITGNTFPVKDALKELGGRWNPALKGWMVPTANASAATALVDLAGGPKAPKTPWKRAAGFPRRGGSKWGRRPTSNVTRFSSGAEIVTNRNGRCEDAPCCGCCT